MSHATSPAQIVLKLKQAIATAANDDHSKPISNARQRHVDRLMAMTSAIEFLETIPEEAVHA